jgi:16S rRNA G966 N2-methylase RsmD
MPAELYIKRAKKPFNVIFLDPPFPYQFKWELIANITASKLVANGTKILIHRPRQDYLKTKISNLEKYDSREYGRSIVDFFLCFSQNSYKI